MQYRSLVLFLVRGRSSQVSQKRRDLGHPAFIRKPIRFCRRDFGTSTAGGKFQRPTTHQLNARSALPTAVLLASFDSTRPAGPVRGGYSSGLAEAIARTSD